MMRMDFGEEGIPVGKAVQMIEHELVGLRTIAS